MCADWRRIDEGLKDGGVQHTPTSHFIIFLFVHYGCTTFTPFAFEEVLHFGNFIALNPYSNDDSYRFSLLMRMAFHF